MSQPAARIRPAGPSLTVARRPAGPVRRVPALRPVTLPDPGIPSAATAPAATRARSTAPAQGAATRAPLGAPLSELPATAVPLAKDAPVPHPAPGARTASGPVLPVVQRRAEGTTGTEGSHDGRASGTAGGGTPDGPAAPAGIPHRPPARTGARARGGLGAPLPALPPSADLPGATASGADGRPGPVRQNRGSHSPAAPPTTDRERPAEPASRTTGGNGADAPLLGAGDVQRRLAADSAGPDTADSAGPSTSRSGPPHHANGPATPLVTPSPATGPRGPAPAVAAGGAGAAEDARRPGTASGGGRGSDGQRHRDPAAPGPLVVARSVSEGTSGVSGGSPLGPAGPHPLTVTRSAARSAPAAPRTLSLLAARPLSLNTRPPEGAARPAARTDSRPVVAARWPATPAAPRTTPAQPTASPSRAPAAARGNPVPPVREPARPTPGRSAVAPATAPIQRAAAVRPGPEGPGLRTTGSAASVQRVPVVRPAPPHPETPGPGAHAPSTAVPTRALPVTAPQAPPLADRPSAASAPAPAATVPVVRRRSAGPGGVTGGTATPVQRTGSGAGDRVPPGGPAKAVPAPGRQRSASVSASATGSASAATSASARSAAQRAEPAPDPGLDLDDLARRLLDPVARLLRAELRRGRERTGRPHDGRR
ncbi:hypothetical protein ACFV83_01030 [Streptomyces pharetrae]|uniref:hypothetical protein n=1 Tax=Streptomyces pharetrae TaxID=291370 RepID=UPI00365879FE